MLTTKKYDTFYFTGEADGIRSMHRRISPVTIYIVPRHLLSQAKKISGLDRPGIYYLVNESEKDRLYIGQSRNGINRLDDNNRTKDFWDTAILFLADRNTFTLDIISGLEKHAILTALNSNRYKLENIATSKNKVDMSELSIVEENFDEVEFIEEIFNEVEFVLTTLGYKMDVQENIITPTPTKIIRTKQTMPKPEMVDEQILKTTTNGIKAFGIYKGGAFVILKDSQIDISRKVIDRHINNLRNAALKNGDIVQKTGSKYFLTKDIEFNSPSGAAKFVLGSSRNGWIEWKNQEGKTLDEICRNK